MYKSNFSRLNSNIFHIRIFCVQNNSGNGSSVKWGHDQLRHVAWSGTILAATLFTVLPIDHSQALTFSGNDVSSGRLPTGSHRFRDNSVLNADIEGAIKPLTSILVSDSSVVNASVFGAIGNEPGRRIFLELGQTSQFKALATGAVGNSSIRLYGDSVLNVLAEDALSTSTTVQFHSLYKDFPSLVLNGFSTSVGGIEAVAGFENGVRILNGGSSDSGC